MDKLKITLIPGDGIGPEITKSARRIVDAMNIGIEWDVVEAGEAVYKKQENSSQTMSIKV